MPTKLPYNPNLEHLKKQAKALLDAFQQNQPQAVERFKTLRLKDAPQLSDAQHLIAREYGFDNWSKLKEHVESLAAPTREILQEARRAFEAGDAAAFRQLLERYPILKTKINEPVADFDSPLINHVRSKAMLDVLLDAGADINARSRWWAGGFGLLDCASPELAVYAIERGAVVTVHAAARLGNVRKTQGTDCRRSAKRRYTSPPRSRSLNICSIMARISTRVTWIMNPLPRSTWSGRVRRSPDILFGVAARQTS